MAERLYLESIRIELSEKVSLLLWHEHVLAPEGGFDVRESPGPPLRFSGKRHKGEIKTASIIYSSLNPTFGIQSLILFENTVYHWQLRGPEAEKYDSAAIESSLKPVGNGPKKADWISPQIAGVAPKGYFKVANYLGTADLRVAPLLPVIRFEIQSRKFDFHGEYSAMVADIASHCQQLLLEWESPTSFNISPDPIKQRKVLLEQFLFLRHVLGGEKLELYLEEIRRRPHAALNVEHEWMPAFLARNLRFASNPLRYGRDWQAVNSQDIFSVRGFTPGEIQHERRYETFDTSPNRFIKFALGAFRDVCEEVMEGFSDQRGTAWLEASEMRDTLDVFLAQPFFSDVSRLERLPFESQTLQKREGYRDILLAWLMLDTASRIDWPGRDDAYDGTNRDAATLYEYWLYFILRDALKRRLGMREIRNSEFEGEDEAHFLIIPEKGGLQINLAQNKKSISRFRWTSKNGEEIGVHLFYNRVFERSLGPLGEGTYSRRFRPDYTIVFFPAEYLSAAKWSKAELLASESGRIGYLHFDAKYRIEDLTKIFGEDADADLDNERCNTKTTDTYRRGDLYKMHTYNDAIRRTAGSYILYPGSDGGVKTTFVRYEEIVPGVGAFRLRPGDKQWREKCENALADFIGDVLNHHVNTFSRDYRIRHWTRKTLKETSAAYHSTSIPKAPMNEPPSDTRVLLAGYRSPEVLKLGHKKLFAFFHAIDSAGRPTAITPEKLSAPVVVPYFKGSNGWEWAGWQAKSSKCSLISRKSLIDQYLESESLLGSDTQFYYIVVLEEPSFLDSSKLGKITDLLPMPAVPKTCMWTELFGC